MNTGNIPAMEASLEMHGGFLDSPKSETELNQPSESSMSTSKTKPTTTQKSNEFHKSKKIVSNEHDLKQPIFQFIEKNFSEQIKMKSELSEIKAECVKLSNELNCATPDKEKIATFASNIEDYQEFCIDIRSYFDVVLDGLDITLHLIHGFSSEDRVAVAEVEELYTVSIQRASAIKKELNSLFAEIQALLDAMLSQLGLDTKVYQNIEDVGSIDMK